MNRPPSPPHEAEILRAIADGVSHTDLLRMGTWTVANVEDALARNDLAVTAGGTIVRVGKPLPTLADLMDNSPNPKVRQAAARAHAALIALEGAHTQERAGRAIEQVRRDQRAAVAEWQLLLRRLLHDAEQEMRRLSTPSPRSRTTKAAS